VFEISYDGFLITDAKNNIVLVNAAFTYITGYTAEEVIGKNPRLHSSGKQSREFYTDMWKTLIETGHWQGEVWNRRKNGEAYPAYLSIATVKDDTGNICNYIGTIIDITTEKQKEEQRLNQEIALRNTLVREVHHRIKNSLQGVTSLLRQTIHKNPELHDIITDVISQVRSIALTHGLQGKNTQSQILLKDLVLEIATNNQILWHNNFTVDISPQLKSWVVNEEEGVPLALVLNELALNAIKHHQHNTEICITLTEESLDHGVAITFSNHGQLSQDAHSPNEPNKGTGLTLVDLLLSEHSELTWKQHNDLVIVRLVLKPPVISSTRTENNHVDTPKNSI
jgi:PAS domain S-box-containing protein